MINTAKKYGVLAVIMAFALLALFLPSVARASEGDFAFQYYFDPTITGVKGGDVDLTFQVKNIGQVDISWVQIDINTAEQYSQRWSDMSLKPQQTATLYATVPFRAEDVNVTKKLQITEGITTLPDSYKSANFTIEGTQNVLHTGFSSSKDDIYTGDAIEFTYAFRNEMKKGDIKDFKVYTYLQKDGNKIAEKQEENLGDIPPGQSVKQILSYTFEHADAGSVDAYYSINYSYLGRNYAAVVKKGVNVEEQAAPPTEAVSEEPSAAVTERPSPTVSASPSPTVSPSPSPTVSASPSPTVSASPSPTVSLSPMVSPQDTALQVNTGIAGGSYIWLYIGGAAAVVIAGGVAAAVLIKKKKSGNK